MNTQEPCQRSITSAYSIQGNTIDRDAKQNGSGISSEIAHTLDEADRHGVMAFKQGNGAKARGIGAAQELSPTLSAAESGTNQVPAVVAVDCRNGTENECINGTLQAKAGGGTSLNINNVIRENR